MLPWSRENFVFLVRGKSTKMLPERRRMFMRRVPVLDLHRKNVAMVQEEFSDADSFPQQKLSKKLSSQRTISENAKTTLNTANT